MKLDLRAQEWLAPFDLKIVREIKSEPYSVVWLAADRKRKEYYVKRSPFETSEDFPWKAFSGTSVARILPKPFAFEKSENETFSIFEPKGDVSLQSLWLSNQELVDDDFLNALSGILRLWFDADRHSSVSLDESVLKSRYCESCMPESIFESFVRLFGHLAPMEKIKSLEKTVAAAPPLLLGITHNDFGTGNLMISYDDERSEAYPVGIVDWAEASFGPKAYDWSVFEYDFKRRMANEPGTHLDWFEAERAFALRKFSEDELRFYEWFNSCKKAVVVNFIYFGATNQKEKAEWHAKKFIDSRIES